MWETEMLDCRPSALAAVCGGSHLADYRNSTLRVAMFLTAPSCLLPRFVEDDFSDDEADDDSDIDVELEQEEAAKNEIISSEQIDPNASLLSRLFYIVVLVWLVALSHTMVRPLFTYIPCAAAS